ncbi:MAG: N-acetyltransferase [Candidatus Hydrogenedentes bacterium]|nr:N-acetyltransferase [Candidatus Hydrogenedentota bacterium]
MSQVVSQRCICKPTVQQVSGIKSLIDAGVKQGAMLPRALMELYEGIRDFHVYVDEQGVGGCCALHVDMRELAEVRSLVVREDLRGSGIGAHLVEACLVEARALGISRVYALTRVNGFFQRLGFHEVDRRSLPTKVFNDCVRCHLFPECDEIAMVRDVNAGGADTVPAADESDLG